MHKGKLVYLFTPPDVFTFVSEHRLSVQDPFCWTQDCSLLGHQSQLPQMWLHAGIRSYDVNAPFKLKLLFDKPLTLTMFILVKDTIVRDFSWTVINHLIFIKMLIFPFFLLLVWRF